MQLARLLLERFRCLIVADGFYEWRTHPGGGKGAFHIARPDGEPFAFAGLWSIWRGPEDNVLRTATILTTDASDELAPLHDRMPVILDRSTEDRWLGRELGRGELAAIARASRAQPLRMRPVGPAVNDARRDGPECLEPAAPRGQLALL